MAGKRAFRTYSGYICREKKTTVTAQLEGKQLQLFAEAWQRYYESGSLRQSSYFPFPPETYAQLYIFSPNQPFVAGDIYLLTGTRTTAVPHESTPAASIISMPLKDQTNFFSFSQTNSRNVHGVFAICDQLTTDKEDITGLATIRRHWRMSNLSNSKTHHRTFPKFPPNVLLFR